MSREGRPIQSQPGLGISWGVEINHPSTVALTHSLAGTGHWHWHFQGLTGHTLERQVYGAFP